MSWDMILNIFRRTLKSASALAWSLGPLLVHLITPTPANGHITLTGTVKVTTPINNACWVFHHMQKSGGTTVKDLLRDMDHGSPIKRGAIMRTQWKQGKTKAEELLNSDKTLFMGGYAEGFRWYGLGKGCKWFTVFRHPISRAVSAFYYCKYVCKTDDLCARKQFDISKATFVEFAEFWSNHGMIHYMMAFFGKEEVMTSPSVQSCGDNCPGWYQLKLFLNDHYETQSRVETAGSNETLVDAVMYGFLQPVQDLLSYNYTAIGLLEDFDTSLRLFEVALDIPGFDWVETYAAVGKKNTAASVVESEKASTLRKAMVDPAVKKYFWLDLVLYEHAVSLHREQLDRYGLS